MQKPVLILASLGLILVAWRAGTVGEPRLAVAVVIGALGGVALYHAAFGFTGSWRRLVRERRTAGCRAQLLLLAITCCLSFPLMDYGEAIGITANGWVVPMTLTSAFGAALFGVGMQLGGGCGSGTLFTVGGGSTRMMLTLMAFIAGSVWWTGTGSAFHGSPSLGSVSLLSEFGALGALLLILAVLGVLALLLRKIEQDAHGMLETPRGMG
ncbi:MAG: YeeE/YedE thiosulfate transporter family protein, partial [Pseudomonadota bacterium]